MGSTRLPGKVLKELCERTVLWHVVNRVEHAKDVDKVVVATTTEDKDDEIVRWCESEGVAFFRGSSEDVLDRYYRAALDCGAKTIVRITSDCPLIDPSLVDMATSKFKEGGFDYVSVGGTYPDGLDTEVFSMIALEKAQKKATLGSEREHVTPFIWKRPERFRIYGFKAAEDYSKMRWTVDDEQDLLFVRSVYEGFKCSESPFGMEEILEFLRDNPKLSEINSGTMRNEGYVKSLREDEAAGEKPK
jgi:spore coat polysaccharide biosynthesis protein SpsF (cytidylyltransferase family)